jgi:hypothetical protein
MPPPNPMMGNPATFEACFHSLEDRMTGLETQYTHLGSSMDNMASEFAQFRLNQTQAFEQMNSTLNSIASYLQPQSGFHQYTRRSRDRSPPDQPDM